MRGISLKAADARMTHFTVPATYPRVQHATASGVVTYSFPFPIFDDVDLSVFIDEYPLSGYSVTGLRQASGGSITFPSPLEPGRTLTILRSRPIKRLTDFADGGEFRADVVNDELDSLTMAAQQLDEAGSRALHIAPPVKGVDMGLPAPLPARRAILTDAEADGFEYSTYDPDSTVEIAQEALETAQDAKDAADSAIAAVQNVGAGSQRAWGPFILEEGRQGYGPLSLAPPHAGAIEMCVDGLAQPLNPGPGQPPAWTIGDEHGPGLTVVLTALVKQNPLPGELQAGLPIFGTVLGGIAEAAISSGALQERHLADGTLNLLGPKFKTLEPNIWRFGTDGAGRIAAFGVPAIISTGTVNALEYVDMSAADHWPGLQAAANRAADLKHALLIPSGDYTLSRRLETVAPMRIFGCGSGQTRLIWPSSATSSSIRITSDNDDKFVEVGDLTLETGGKGGTALDLDFSGQVDYGTIQPGWTNIWDRWSPRFRVERVHMLGSDSRPRAASLTTTGWDYGVLATAAMAGVVADCSFVGWINPDTAVTSGSPGAFVFQGVNETYQNGHPVEFTVRNSRVYYSGYGVRAINCEGVYVDTCPMIAVLVGVWFKSNIGHPYLRMVGCDTACYQYGVIGQNINDSIIDGNLFYQRPDTGQVFTGVFLDGGQGNKVCNNTVRGKFNPARLTNGIVLGTGSLHNVMGNNLMSCETGIWLQSGCTNTRVSQINTYWDCTNTLVDNGTGNALL